VRAAILSLALLPRLALAEGAPAQLSAPPPPPRVAVAIPAPGPSGPAGDPFPAGAPAAVGGEQAPSAPAPEFIKGELSHLGQVDLALQNNRAGVRLGYEYLDGFDYLRVTPTVDLRLGGLRMGFGIPMRLEMCRGDVALAGCVDISRLSMKPYDHRWTFRSQDWRSPSDFARVIRYLGYGQKEANLFVQVTQENAATVGHGGVMRRYFAGADVARQRVSAEVDAYNDTGGFEAFVNDVVNPNLWTALAFVKPLSPFSEDPTARSLSLGVTWGADLRAPTALQPGATLVNAERPLDLYRTRAVQLWGVDAEVKVVKTESWDVKPYVEWARLQGAGSGLSLGVLTRASWGGKQALRVILEGRRFDADYLPSYFDTFYEIQKVQYVEGREDPTAAAAPTKWEAVSTRAGGPRMGYTLEATWSWVKAVSISAGLETATSPLVRSAYLHVEAPALSWLQFFATLHRRSFQGQSWFTAGAVDLPSTVFYSGARLRLLPILFVNGTASQTFSFDRALGRYQSVKGFWVDLELGWEWAPKE